MLINVLVAGVGFEPTTFRLWAWWATGLLHPATKYMGLLKIGGYLLSHILRCSTIGATVLNGRVRDGIECFTRAITTKFKKTHLWNTLKILIPSTRSYQAYRVISTSQLNALLRLHLWPIEVVVFHYPQGRPCFEGGFPLRCFQRLSCPNLATQRCSWRNNWYTRGSFTPVLSY